MIPCFFCEPTGDYEITAGIRCSACDQVTTVLLPTPSERDDSGHPVVFGLLETVDYPDQCSCGGRWRNDSRWVGSSPLYRRVDTGEVARIGDMPVGALYYRDYLCAMRPNMSPGEWAVWRGEDGHTLACKTPGGDWIIDSRASNCTLKDDIEHRCWVRHGNPEDPQGAKGGQPLTVDKSGLTCNAGAGSIQCGGYHGFLQNGFLT